jgi:hypothetical protein
MDWNASGLGDGMGPGVFLNPSGKAHHKSLLPWSAYSFCRKWFTNAKKMKAGSSFCFNSLGILSKKLFR